MTYLQLLNNFEAKANHKVYALVGGETRFREDALRVLHRRIENTLKKKTKEKILRAWYHFTDAEVLEAPLDILHESIFSIRTIIWAPGFVANNKEVTEEFLNGLSELSGYSVVVDASSEILPIFTSIYKKFGKGAVVNCSKKPSLKIRGTEGFGGFVTARLQVAGVKLPSIPVLLDLTAEDMTIDTLFNIFSVVEALGKKELKEADLRQFNLLRRDPETFLVEKLFNKGKQEVLRYSFREVNSKKFFEKLYWGLVLRLQVKSTKFMRGEIASSKLKMDMKHYYDYQDELKKVDYRTLYRRLYLVFSLLRWRTHGGSVYLALLYW